MNFIFSDNVLVYFVYPVMLKSKKKCISPKLLTRDAIYFRRISNPLYSMEEKRKFTFKIIGLFPMLN